MSISIISLKQMCPNNVAASFFRNKEMKEDIRTPDVFHARDYGGVEFILDSRVSEKISEILPIKILQDEILRTISFYKCNVIILKAVHDLKEVDLADFSWNLEGTIDELKTAENVIEDCNQGRIFL
ncbi:hypothetical protein CDAR_515391 [Caerostris darwini]|uniref:Uncharacterized protein n=1 Tax=Caerostris darwini TaxID=1538125 RepID=A0AAV4PTV5_9ARAC|nr:hypothetical protein CDAR_515391 [Caerostris darwini]